MIYAGLSLITDKTLFLVIIISNRSLEGWSLGLILCTVYGVASQELKPSEFDKYSRTCSAVSGVGSCLTLIFGPMLFSVGGYFLPYFAFSVTLVLLSIVIWISGVLNEEIPKVAPALNEDLSKNLDESQPEKPKIDLKFIMSIKVHSLVLILL